MARPTPHDERQAAGAARVDLYVPADAVADLVYLTELQARREGVQPARARTLAVVRAIREQARRERRKVRPGA